MTKCLYYYLTCINAFMTNTYQKKTLNHMKPDVFFFIGKINTREFNTKNPDILCIFKGRDSILYVSIFLFLPGCVTLRTTYTYFKRCLTKICETIYPPPEKPNRLFTQYRIASLTLMLNQWRIANQHESLALVLYAAMPRNPE